MPRMRGGAPTSRSATCALLSLSSVPVQPARTSASQPAAAMSPVGTPTRGAATSLGSGCADDSAVNPSRQSSTSRAMIPAVSRQGASGAQPSRSIAPKLGLNPTTPHHAAGTRRDPAESAASASGTTPAATAAAAPPEDPPGLCPRTDRVVVSGVSRRLPGHGPCELVHRGRADHNRTCFAQLRHCDGITIAHKDPCKTEVLW